MALSPAQLAQLLNGSFSALGEGPLPVFQSGMLGRDHTYRGGGGANVAKSFADRLSSDYPPSSVQLAINGAVPPKLPSMDTAMAFVPPTASPGKPAPVAAMRPQVKTQVIGTPIQQQQQPQGGLLGLINSLFGDKQPARSDNTSSGGLLGMFKALGQSSGSSGSSPSHITAPGGGGAYVARPGSFGESIAGANALLPAAMNNSRWM